MELIRSVVTVSELRNESAVSLAWLYTALKPKGRDSFGVLLFLSIDTSNGNIYGDDVVVDDYLLEVDD